MPRLKATPEKVQELLRLLSETRRRITSCTAGMREEQLACLPGKKEWSALNILSHLRACQDLWSFRFYAMLSQDRPDLPLFDERRWAKSRRFQDLAFHISLQAFSLEGEELLQVLRHADITALDGEEARTFGGILARVSRALRDVTGADLVFVYVFGGGIPHLHIHLAHHHPGDALNTQMIRGEIMEEKMASGATRYTSKDFPALPESEQRTVASKIQQRLISDEGRNLIGYDQVIFQ